MSNAREFLQQGFAVKEIPSALLAALKQIEASLHVVPEDSWTRVIKGAGETIDYPVSSPEAAVGHAEALAMLDSGQLCYSFQRIRCEGGNLALPAIGQLKNFLLSPAICAFVASHTARQVSELALFYVNKFGNGDFLTTHRDSGTNLALVISLTDNWDANNGGITFMLDQDKQIMRALLPRFGQALMLDCSDNTVPHFVSTVTSSSDRYRTAIVARYA